MKHLYIVETERLEEDGRWLVDDPELHMEFAENADHLIRAADRWPLEPGQKICVRQIADDVDWRTVTVVEPEMYENIYVRWMEGNAFYSFRTCFEEDTQPVMKTIEI